MTEVSLSHLFRYLVRGKVSLPRKAVFAIKEQTREWAQLWARERLVVKMRIPVADEPPDPVLYIPAGDLAVVRLSKIHARMIHGCRKDERIAWPSVRVSADIIGVMGSASRRFCPILSAWQTSYEQDLPIGTSVVAAVLPIWYFLAFYQLLYCSLSFHQLLLISQL